MSLSITELILVLIAWWFLTALYVFATGLIGNWAGLSLKCLSIGVGPTLYSFRLLGGRVSLRPIPLGGSTVFWGDESEESEDWHGPRLLSLPLRYRIPVILVGPLSNLLLGGLLIALSPTRIGLLLGIFGMWLGLVNLLPLPALNGGALLFALIPQTRFRSMNTFLPDWALPSSLLIFLSLNIGFLWIFMTKIELLLAWFRA